MINRSCDYKIDLCMFSWMATNPQLGYTIGFTHSMQKVDPFFPLPSLRMTSPTLQSSTSFFAQSHLQAFFVPSLLFFVAMLSEAYIRHLENESELSPNASVWEPVVLWMGIFLSLSLSQFFLGRKISNSGIFKQNGEFSQQKKKGEVFHARIR